MEVAAVTDKFASRGAARSFEIVCEIFHADNEDRTVASSTRVLKSHAASASRDRTVASNVLARGT